MSKQCDDERKYGEHSQVGGGDRLQPAGSGVAGPLRRPSLGVTLAGGWRGASAGGRTPRGYGRLVRCLGFAWSPVPLPHPAGARYRRSDRHPVVTIGAEAEGRRPASPAGWTGRPGSTAPARSLTARRPTSLGSSACRPADAWVCDPAAVLVLSDSPARSPTSQDVGVLYGKSSVVLTRGTTARYFWDSRRTRPMVGRERKHK